MRFLHPAGVKPTMAAMSRHFALVRSLSGSIHALCGVLAAALLLVALSGCSVHTGGSELAFLRGGQLWVVQGDGTNARMLAGGGIVGFAWSPDHHSLVFRAVQNPRDASSSPAADAASSLQAISINGGYSLQITPDNPGVALSNAFWDANGNRVLYREANLGTLNSPLFIVSQTDQALGLARKVVANAATIPAVAPDGQRVAVIDSGGQVLLGSTGGTMSVFATGALATLPQTGRPGRILWQPGHDALLYATTASGGVALVLHPIGGAARTVATASALIDVAFSPDGALLLVRTPTEFAVWSVKGGSSPLFTWAETDPYALPWWSPNSKQLVIQDAAGLELAGVATQHVALLLRVPQPTASSGTPQFWFPATGSPISPDGASFVFAGIPGATWQGKALPSDGGSGSGLYVAALDANKTAAPTSIDGATDVAPSWSYADSATVFLV